MHDRAVDFGLLGCGGMGRRHVIGLAELRRVTRSVGVSDLLRLTAVCDVDDSRARMLADEVEVRTGHRPLVVTSIDEMPAVCEAVDITTPTGSHHPLGLRAMELGLDVLLEKPLAINITLATELVVAAVSTGRVLAVAENVRREPVNRLARALIAADAIGQPRFVLDIAFSGGDAILLTPWRHRLASGGLQMDVAIHAADVLEYLLGPIDEVTGWLRLDEPLRARRGRSPLPSAKFYDDWANDVPSTLEADAEDVAVALLRFEQGAIGQWTVHLAAHGQPRALRVIHGSRGSLELPADRSGGTPVLTTDDGERLVGHGLLGLVPNYRLGDLEAAIWGGSRIAHYSAEFDVIDRNLVAIELADFARAVRDRQPSEVDGYTARRSMAVVQAVGESSMSGRPVTVAGVERGDLHMYDDRVAAASLP